MKRPEALVTLSRRQFCGGLASCLGIAAVASCSSNSTSNNPDAPTSHDAPNMGACGSSNTDVGAPSAFTSGKPVYFGTGNFFVVRDSNGLYALTARCTHQGITTMVVGSEFHCPQHGANFDFNGNVISGPVFNGLVHYAMCMLSNGHVGVNTAQTVAQSQRLNA